MNRNRLLVAALAALMTLSVLAPAGAVAAQEDSGGDDLTISVAQDDGIVVTVESNGTAVANATVDVSTTDENDTYAGTGTYTTDENGTVTLDAPTGNESVEVSIAATTDDGSAETTVTLDPVEEEGPKNFGDLVSQFVADNKGETDGPFGLAVASFVVENNPGNAPDHAGPPAHAGPPGDGDEKDERGPPDHAKGQSDDADDEEDEEDEADAENEDGADNSKGNGNGKKGNANGN